MYLEIEEEKYKKIILLIGEFDAIKKTDSVLIPLEVYTDIINNLMDLIYIDREHIEDLERENQILILNTPQVEDVERGNYF